MRQYRFHVPGDFGELFKFVEAERGAEIRYLAGGTDLTPRISREREQIPYSEKPPLSIVSLAGLGLDEVAEKNGEIVIGATATLTALLENPVIGKKLPVLCEAIREMAGFSVRNTATIGGNIMNASPAADSLPPLVALDAEMILRSAAGERRVKAGAFFTGPGRTVARDGEVLAAVAVKPGSGRASFRKLGRRAAETLSVVNAGAYVEQDKEVFTAVRVAIGSVAPTVVDCRKVAAALSGQPVAAEAVRKAAALVVQEISPISDIRASDWYRREIAPVMVSRAILAAAGIENEGR